MRVEGNVLIMIAVGIAVLFIVAVRRNAEWLLNIVMRSILGTAAIYLINMGLAAAGFACVVGVNVVTVLTTGILGFPGLLALYGIGFYNIL